MPKIVVAYKVEVVAKWKSFDEECWVNMTAFGSDIETFVDTSGGNAVALSMTVSDPAGLQAFIQSEACEAIMRRHGGIKPVTLHGDG